MLKTYKLIDTKTGKVVKTTTLTKKEKITFNLAYAMNQSDLRYI